MPTSSFEMDKEHVPGLSLAAVKDGKVVKLKGYGASNLELNVPAVPDTVYELGSISKQFTAAAVLILVQENKIGLDDLIGKYIHESPETRKAIKVRHLLTHTSGLQSSRLCARRMRCFQAPLLAAPRRVGRTRSTKRGCCGNPRVPRSSDFIGGCGR